MSSANTGKTVTLRILSTPTHLPVVRAALEKACELAGFDSETTGGVVLSVDEALTNVIRHAYQGAEDKEIEIEWSPLGDSGAGGLRIRLRDHGQWVDPSSMRGRDLADVRPGGLGVHIMRKCMDEVRYTPAEGGGTVLTMIKRIPPKQERQS